MRTRTIPNPVADELVQIAAGAVRAAYQEDPEILAVSLQRLAIDTKRIADQLRAADQEEGLNP